jgi:hypothetical protein
LAVRGALRVDDRSLYLRGLVLEVDELEEILRVATETATRMLR